MLQALKDAPEVVITADPGCSHNLQVQHWPLHVGLVNSALRHHACVNAAMFPNAAMVPAAGGRGQMHNSTGADVAIGLNSYLDRCTCSDWRPCFVCADRSTVATYHMSLYHCLLLQLA